VAPDGDGSSTLFVTLYPFFYNPLTTDVRFYQDYTFQIRYSTPGITITWLSLAQTTLEPGEQVTVELTLENGGPPADVVVETAIHRYGSDELVDGLLLRYLTGFSGPASFSPVWDSHGAAPGEYYVRVTLRETDGDVVQAATRRFNVGTVAAEMTALAATPQVFDIGQSVDLSLDVRNSGTVPLSGAALLEVRSVGGASVARFAHEFSSLAAGQSLHFGDVWDSSGSAPGEYTVLGSVHYDSTVVSSALSLTGRGAGTIYLPVVLKRQM
jgi:hypothetical protein